MGVNNAYIGIDEIKPEGSVGSPVQLKAAAAAGVGVTIAGISGASTITITGATPFVGLVAGQLIQIAGAANAANNGTKTISAINSNGSVATVTDLLVNEVDGAPSDIAITSLPL